MLALEELPYQEPISGFLLGHRWNLRRYTSHTSRLYCSSLGFQVKISSSMKQIGMMIVTGEEERRTYFCAPPSLSFSVGSRGLIATHLIYFDRFSDERDTQGANKS